MRLNHDHPNCYRLERHVAEWEFHPPRERRLPRHQHPDLQEAAFHIAPELAAPHVRRVVHVRQRVRVYVGGRWLWGLQDEGALYIVAAGFLRSRARASLTITSGKEAPA